MRHRPVVHEAPRHRRKNASLAIAIIGRHARMRPDQLLMFGIDLADVLIVRIVADVDGGDALLDHLDQARADIGIRTGR